MAVILSFFEDTNENGGKVISVGLGKGITELSSFRLRKEKKRNMKSNCFCIVFNKRDKVQKKSKTYINAN